MELHVTLAIEEVSDLLFQSGFRKSMGALTVADKEEVVGAIVDNHMMVKVKSSMDQYTMEGLKVYGLLNNIQTNPEIWMPLFTASKKQMDPGNCRFLQLILYLILP